MNRTGLILVMLASALWATTGIAAGLVPEQSRWSAESLAFARMTLAGPLLLAVAVLTQGRIAGSLRRLHLPSLVIFALACAVFQICLFRSFEVLGVTTTTFLSITLRPFIAMTWDRITGQQTVQRNAVAALTLATAGLLIICFSGGESAPDKSWWIGVPLVLACATAFVAMTYATRSLTLTVSALIVTGTGLTLSSGVLAVFLFVAAASGALPLDRVTFDTPALAMVIYLALVPTAVAFFCFNCGMARCNQAPAGLIAGMIQPTIAALLAVWLIGEHTSMLQLTGCAALTGAMLVLWFDGGSAPIKAPGKVNSRVPLLQARNRAAQVP